MEPPRPRPNRPQRAAAVGAAALLLALGIGTARLLVRRSAPADGTAGLARPGGERQSAVETVPGDGLLAPPPSPSTGWEEAAETVASDLASVLEGHPRTGAFAEATVEAARRDLARFPPDAARVRRLLLGGARERCWALVAVAALPEVDDDLARLVLLSLRPEDDDLQRLLTAEAATALPPALLSRHEPELLSAFGDEPNPLVLVEALPALERMEPARLRQLLDRQLALASPGMVPILVAVARDRLAPEELAELGILVDVGSGGGR